MTFGRRDDTIRVGTWKKSGASELGGRSVAGTRRGRPDIIETQVVFARAAADERRTPSRVKDADAFSFT